MFDAIHTCHIAVGHGGINKTIIEIHKKYDSVQKKIV